MRKADVIAYRAHLAHLERCADYNITRFYDAGLTEDDPSVQRHRGYLMAINDAREAFERLPSARLRLNSHSDPGA